jgi:hypothetical protein
VLYRLYAPGAPDAAPRRIAVDDDEIEVIRDGPPRLTMGRGRPRNLTEIDINAHRVSALRDLDRSLLVYADRFRPEDVDALRRADACGIDRTGQLVLGGRELSVVVARAATTPERAAETTAATLRGIDALEDTAGIRGLATGRLTQLLLETPGRTWRPGDLSGADGLAAPATASRLLAELARLGLVTSLGRGRSHDYRVTQPTLLADWLAERTRPPHPDVTLSCYARVRDIEALIDYLARRIHRVGYAAALSGGAAAHVEGVTVTSSLQRAMVRVDPGQLPGDVFEDFGVTPVSRGANVRFVKDVGHVGTLHPRIVNGIALSGVVRTWLDLRSEPRGHDAAELYWTERVAAEIGSAA